MLTSVQNPQIKEIKSLLQKKNRDNQGSFLIEGVRFVEAAFGSNTSIRLIIHSPKLLNTLRGEELLHRAEALGIERLEVADHVLAHLSDTENPQGVLAVLTQFPKGVIPQDRGLILLVDGVQDPGNLGTIIRTADAAGAKGVILGEGTVDLYNPKTLRSTMGSIFHLPIVAMNAIAALTELKKEGWLVAVADTAGDTSWYQRKLTGPVVLVVGNEARGPREELLTMADYRLTIDMPGDAESLNVAVATGILLFEHVRQNNHQL